MENPSASMMMQVPTSDSGMVTMGISTERMEPRNRKMTPTTMSTASIRVVITSWIEARMNFEES